MTAGEPFGGGPPRDDGPLFDEPWQAQALAIAVALQDAGFISQTEWAAALGQEIAAAGPASDAKDAYYRSCLAAIERLAVEKNLTTRAALLARKDAWDRAIHATPHGQPILLANDPEASPSAR